MEDIEIGLWILEIIAISLSILLASVIAWKLYERGWGQERRERLVSDVLAPLIDEVGSNLERVRQFYIALDENTKQDFLASQRRWKDLRSNPMWRYSASDDLKGLGERLYKSMESYWIRETVADNRFRNILIRTIAELVLGVKSVKSDLEMKIEDGILVMRFDGFKMYCDRDWEVVKEEFADGLGSYIDHLRSEHKDTGVVDVDDILTVMRNRLSKNERLQRFRELRSTILVDGEKFLEDIRAMESENLERLYKKVF